MRPAIWLRGFVVLCAALFLISSTPDPALLREGDIIFQETGSEQGRALKLALQSRYTHVGILFRRGAAWEVLEAVQPVRYTPIAPFLERGLRGHYVIKRLKNAAVLTPAVLTAMKRQGDTYLGRDYDLTFHWSDERIYCSELVWKLYEKQTGLRIGELRPLGSFDLSHPFVRQKLRERYGSKIPDDMPVIPPSAMFESERLIPVVQYPPQ